MAQLNDTMVQGDLRVTGTVFGTTANIPDIYTNDKIAYGDATGQSVLIASRADGGLPNMNVYEATSLNGFVTPLTKYSKVSSDSYKCEFDSIIGGNDGTTDYPMWHHVTYAGTNSWTSSLTRLLTTTSSISSTDDLEPLLTVSRGVVKSSSTGTFPSGVEGTSPSGNILGFNCVSWASLGSNQYGIVFGGNPDTRCGLTYNNSYILGNNDAFRNTTDLGYDSTSHYFQGMSQSARKAKYAEFALSGGVLDNTINDKMNKDASNATTGDGTGAAPTLLEGMNEAFSDITSGDVFIPTTDASGVADGKWYKRKISHLWSWIKSKLTGSDVNIGGNAATATSAYAATYGRNVELDNQSVSLLTKVKELGQTNQHYARFCTFGDGGAANITDRPVTGSEGFVCEAILTRRTSNADYRYQLIYWRRGVVVPYYAHITQASTSISWVQGITSSDGYGGNIAMGSGAGNTLGKALNGKIDGYVDGVPTSLKLIIADSVGSEDNAIYLT